MKEPTLEEREAEMARREAALAEAVMKEAAREAALAEEREALRTERAAIEAAKAKAVREELEADTGSDRFPEAFRSRLWGYAWREGHAYGYESVADQYRDLMEMMEGFDVTPMK